MNFIKSINCLEVKTSSLTGLPKILCVKMAKINFSESGIYAHFKNLPTFSVYLNNLDYNRLAGF